MKIDEAIKILKFQRGYFCDLKGCQEQQAFTMAIASLEAWEKVKAEIDESRDALKTMTEGEWFAGKLKGLDCAVAIIDEHLQEIKNG